MPKSTIDFLVFFLMWSVYERFFYQSIELHLSIASYSNADNKSLFYMRC